MKDRLQFVGQRVWTEFRKFTPGQKVVSVAALLALVVGGYFLVTWKASPSYAPLYTNLAPADASAIIDKLNSSGTAYQLGAGGTEILVPQSAVYSTRIAMSSAGLPGSSDTGYSLLDKEGVTTSQFKQQIDYQRALEGELTKTIESIGGVDAASVHLAIPQQDVFNDGSSKPTAAVLVTTSAANVLTTSQVQSIVYLVSSSVPGMNVNGVTVTDSNGNVLKAAGQDGASSLADASSQNQQTQQFDTNLQNKLQAKLDSILGPGHSNVTVNSVLNFDQTVTTTDKYLRTNLPPTSETTSKETYTGSGSPNATGTLGTTGTAGSGSKNGSYTHLTKTVNNSLSTQRTQTRSATGSVKNLSISVALDSHVKNLNVAAITALVKSGSGYNAARGDALSVQALPFDNSTQQATTTADAAAATADAAQKSHAQLMSMIKQGVLGALVLAVLVAAFLSSRKRKKPAPVPNDDIVFMDDERDTAVEEPALSATVTDLRAAAERRRNLVTAADDRPQDVARVLSGWLNAKES
jgi:flagellar M-ring protein FliF